MEKRGRRIRSALRTVAINAMVLLVLLALLESVLLIVYRLGPSPGGPLWPVFRGYHLGYELPVIQMRPECARYDPQLTYTLRPGRCRFASREFEVDVLVNSAGLRDDEASLKRPEVVVLGDSFAMGWGVGQEQSFPQRLEARIGTRVLNAGVSSYGTVRALGLLPRLDLAALRVLIIQYNGNDYRENRAFMDNDNVLPITDEARYERLVEKHLRKTRGYRFGLFVYELQKRVINGAMRALKPRSEKVRDPRAWHAGEAEAFLHALTEAPANLENVQIIVLEISDSAKNDRLFVDALRSAQQADNAPRHLREMVVVDVSQTLRPAHYLTWDAHMAAEGHDVVARILDEALAELR